jgi:hypothetical protein
MNATMTGNLPDNVKTTLQGYIGSNWRLYAKMSDLNCPVPAMAWIFADESMYTLNDGFLQMNLNTPDYPDVPASYHCDVNCFTFADGHGEPRKWRSTLRTVPYVKGVTGTHVGTSATDPDWLWLKLHTSCP